MVTREGDDAAQVVLHLPARSGHFAEQILDRFPGRELEGARYVPPFDFSVPGVSSISMDLHKYAFAAKGASVKEIRAVVEEKYSIYTDTRTPTAAPPAH